jgi:DNA-binding NarL/FixJ family response regulator
MELGRIRLLLVDDHELFRSSMSLVFELMEGVEVVGQASTGEAALAFCETFQPDAVLMDLLMPGIGGVEAIRLLHERYPQMRILIYTGIDDYELILAGLRAGAAGFVHKYSGVDEVIRTVRAAFDG